MKINEKLGIYFRKREKAIGVLLKKPRKKFTRDDFHRLRVEIKKINAFLKFIDFYAKGFKRKPILRSYKPVFKTAGKIREIQLEEIELKKYAMWHSLKNYCAYLNKEKLKSQIDFFFSIHKDPVPSVKQNSDRIYSFLNRVSKKDAHSFIKKKKKEIEKITEKKELKPKKVHELRKLLKIFYYTRKMLIKKEKNKPLKKIENFQELLGKWHDKVIMADKLEKIIKSETLPKAEIKNLEKLKNKFSVNGNSLLKKINAQKQIELP